MRKLTETEAKLKAAVVALAAATADVVSDLEDGKVVSTQVLIETLETQSGVINTLLNGFLELEV